MDLKQLMDPKLIAFAVTVILVVAGLHGCTCEDVEPRWQSCASVLGRIRAGRATSVRRELKRNWRIVRSGLKVSRSAILIRRSGNASLANGHSLQSRFVDDPKGTVTEADELVSSLMQTRGYPVADFNQRAADISVDHPQVVAIPVCARDCIAARERGSRYRKFREER